MSKMEVFEKDCLDLSVPGVILTPTAAYVEGKLTQDQFEQAFRQLTRMNGAVAWWLGDLLAMGHETYATLTAQLEGECKYEQSTLYEYRYVSTAVAPSIRIENLGWLHHKVVAPLKAREQKKWLKAAAEENWTVAELRKQLKGNPHVAQNSGENEWYTPEEYIIAARLVMGGIDLDPASSDVAQQTVQAAEYFTIDDNGLSHEWHGRVWMNPPYAQPLVSEFCDKLAEHIESGDVTEAIVLVNNATDTKWFRNIAEQCNAICFTTGRVKFLDPEGNPGAPLQGQAIIHIGGDARAFAKHFDEFGFVVFR